MELRTKILRTPLGLRFSPDELADESGSYHIGCYSRGRLCACLVLKPVTDTQIQMRQVAVDQEYRGKGIGSALVQYSEQFAKEHGFRRMILHARHTAVPFYEKLHYRKQGEEFVEVTIPHWEMSKEL